MLGAEIYFPRGRGRHAYLCPHYRCAVPFSNTAHCLALPNRCHSDCKNALASRVLFLPEASLFLADQHPQSLSFFKAQQRLCTARPAGRQGRATARPDTARRRPLPSPRLDAWRAAPRKTSVSRPERERSSLRVAVKLMRRSNLCKRGVVSCVAFRRSPPVRLRVMGSVRNFLQAPAGNNRYCAR